MLDYHETFVTGENCAKYKGIVEYICDIIMS